MDIDGEEISRPISQLAGYGWPTTIAPDGSWAIGTFLGNELRLVTVDDLAKIPTEGQALTVIARIRDTLHFRVFDIDERQIADRSEAELEQSEHLDQLKQLLGEHWNEPQPTPAQQQKIHWLVTKALVIPYREIQRLRCFDFDTGKELAKSVAFEVHA